MYCLIRNHLYWNTILRKFYDQRHSNILGKWIRNFSVFLKYYITPLKPSTEIIHKLPLCKLSGIFHLHLCSHHQDRRSVVRLMSDVHKDQYMKDVPDGVFKGYLDRYNGITVLSKEEYNDLCDFPMQLKKSLEFWGKQKRRCIWFQVDKNHSEWIPHLIKFDFDFHHCRTGGAMLYKWLAEDEENNLPSYAHTMVGVGGLVINQREEILVVTDRHALIPNSIKLPGGIVEPKEDIIQAAIREVFEETGIECSYRSVICLRHTHEMAFGLSDLYFVIALSPLNNDIKIDEREIAQAQWLPIQDYLQHPRVHDASRNLVKIYLANQKDGIQFKAQQMSHPILKKMYTLFSAEKALS